MEFRILGPLEVLDEGRELTPGRAKQRALLAALVLHANEPVASDLLVEALWGERPPQTAQTALHGHVSALRKLLGPERIVTRPPGYQVCVCPGELDAERFDALVAEARAVEDAVERSRLLGEALGLWRGEPLADFRYDEFAQGEIGRLEERRLAVLEDRAEAELALGRHQQLLPKLEWVVGEQPLRERPRGLLMLALYRAGRQSDALEVYQEGRQLLAQELGLDPGPALQALHHQILQQDPALEAPPLAEPASPRQERKHVTVLVAELTPTEPSDPEDLARLVRPVLEHARELVAGFGGTVEPLFSNALIGVFGAPRAHEDDPERAVRASRALVEAVGEEPGLSVRVGIERGDALVTIEGDRVAVTGEVVAAASRLQTRAPPGEVKLGPALMRLQRTDVGRGEIPFVGREPELALLETIRATVLEERMPRLVTIVGEAGIGKTRLTGELIRRMEPGTVVYRGRCLPYGEGITYWALREILWAAAGILLDEPGAVASTKLHALVGRLIEDPAESERTAAALARTAGIAIPDSPFDRMTPESLAEEVGLAWPRFLGALAAQRLTVVVVEDLHWAEAPLLDVLERLASRSAGPLLVVTTARTEFGASRPNWSSTPGVVLIGLERLTEAQSRELVQSLLPGAGDELRDRVVAPAEGNPFFAEQIAHHIAEEASSAGMSEVKTTIPNSVQALVAARIDGLPETEKRTLHDAAVVGRTFWASTLESMAGGGSVRPALQALEDKGFITASTTSLLPGQPEFSFRHALGREVAYRSIPRAQRCRAHAAVGGWIEEVAGDRRAEFVELLAYHYESAAMPDDAAIAWPEAAPEHERVRDEAVQALIAAGSAARERLAYDQAAGFADRALALAATDTERVAGLELRAAALHAGVRCDEAFAAYQQALELARKLGDDDAYSRLQAHAVLLCVRYSGAFTTDAWKEPVVELVERGLAELDERAMSFEVGALLIGRAAIGRAWFTEATGYEDTAEDDARRAVEIAEAIDSPYLLSHAVDTLSDAATGGGFCHAGELAERLLTVSTTLPDRAEAHDSLVTATISFAAAGQYERAREVARLTTQESERLAPHHRIHAAAAETICLIPAGRFVELLEVTERIPEIFREEGHGCLKAWPVLAGRALALFERGEPSAASEALELLEALPPGRGFEGVRCVASEIVRPVAGLERTRRIVATLGRPPAGATNPAYPLRVDLQLSVLARDWVAADQLVAQARELAPRACAPTLAWIADWAQAVRIADAGDGDEAVAQAKRAARALSHYGEPYSAARLLVDLLPFLGGDQRPALALELAKRLEAMGAHASATEAAAAVQGIASV